MTNMAGEIRDLLVQIRDAVTPTSFDLEIKGIAKTYPGGLGRTYYTKAGVEALPPAALMKLVGQVREGIRDLEDLDLEFADCVLGAVALYLRNTGEAAGGHAQVAADAAPEGSGAFDRVVHGTSSLGGDGQGAAGTAPGRSVESGADSPTPAEVLSSRGGLSGEWIVTRESDLAAAFTEWDRRFREEPERFLAESTRVLTSDPDSYGEACAPYLVALLSGEVADQ